MKLPLYVLRKRIKLLKREIRACDGMSKNISEFLNCQSGNVIRTAIIGLISTISVADMGIKMHKTALESDLKKEEADVKRVQSRKRLRASRK